MDRLVQELKKYIKNGFPALRGIEKNVSQTAFACQEQFWKTKWTQYVIGVVF